jgi:hypothetical protein
MFHAVVTAALGWLMVTAPLTVSRVEPLCVSELAVPAAANVKVPHVAPVFSVTVAPVAIERPAKVVLEEPPMVLLAPVNETVPLPAVNAEVELLFAQLPARLMVVAVPAANVPEVRVKSPLTVRVVVLPPTVTVWPESFTMRLLKVWLAAEPPIVCPAVVLLKVIVQLLGVNVPPLFDQLPPTV